jgi:ribosomal protein L12E/L44/L45/RPP1/RPP2
MIVVAIARGYYGGKSRYEGERFAITEPAHFSKKWMVDPNGPDMTSAYRALEAAYVSSTSRPNSRSVTDEQLLAEVTQSAGVVAGLRLENIKLKEKVSALQGQIDQLLAKGATGVAVRKAPSRAERAEAVKADEAEQPEPTDFDGDASAEEAGDVTAREEAAPRRVRRTG